jgi:hypothetical protein
MEGVLKIVTEAACMSRAQSSIIARSTEPGRSANAAPTFQGLQRTRGGPVFGTDVVKHAFGLPHSVNGHRGHNRGADEK